ncbi:hypothetical protein NP233_g1845 [Leucocoprinus birnbaumii]|uniref:E3 ubiquitin-protein ligase listerin n=1 Tax=Leucocoprinus birnbaumii TaxID=56174 RepID=A0AAD5YZE8_9AGAR|nr:hypothetical protein NP233_g1845 [Leucocoprinus birnbaumii]
MKSRGQGDYCIARQVVWSGPEFGLGCEKIRVTRLKWNSSLLSVYGYRSSTGPLLSAYHPDLSQDLSLPGLKDPIVMVKGQGKSSASSNTRKKQLKKAAASLGIELDPSSSAKNQPGKPKNKEKSGRGKKEGKKEPRVKVYIPPVKPARAQPDPLEVGGLARRLPPELVVVLKNVGKKAQITKTRGIGRFGMHYIPPLFVHPSRRVRHLAISVHSNLLKIPEVRDQVLFHLQEAATSESVESVLGTWCVLAHDIEKSVSNVGKDSWDSFVRLPPDQTKEANTADNSTNKSFLVEDSSRNAILSFVQRTILDPLSVYAYLNPPPASNVPTPPDIPTPKNRRPGGSNKQSAASKHQQLAAAIAAARKGGIEVGEPARSKTEEYEESETDRKARLRIGGLGSLQWFLENGPLSEEILSFLHNPLLWSVLYHGEKAPFVETNDRKDFDSTESFGFGQPNVRKAGWGLVMRLLETHKENISRIVPVLSSAILRSAWVEPDPLVQGVMWQPLLTFLKDFPKCWDLELASSYAIPLKDPSEGDEDDSDDEEEEEEEGQETKAKTRTSRRTNQIITSLSRIPAIPPTWLLRLSPSRVFHGPNYSLHYSLLETPLEDLFTSLWAALDGRALSSLHRAATSAAFLSALLESVVFMARRLVLDAKKTDESTLSSSDGLDVPEQARKLVREQFGKVWDELKGGRLKVEERAGARLVAQNLDALERVDLGIENGQGEQVGMRDAAWSVVETGLRGSTTTNPALVAAFLKVLHDHFKEGTEAKKVVGELVYSMLNDSVSRIADSLQTEVKENIKENIRFLECMVEQFREGLFDDPSFAQRFDSLVQTQTTFLFETSLPFLFSYLAHRKSEDDALALWHSLLKVIAANAHNVEKMRRVAMEVIRVAQKGDLPKYLKPDSTELDDIVGKSLGTVLNGEAGADLDVVKAVMRSHQYFISDAGYANFFEAISTSVTVRVEMLIGGSTQEDFDLIAFHGPIELLDLVTSQDDAPTEGVLEEVLPNVFLLGHIIPECAVYGFDTNSPVFSTASTIWRREIDVQKIGQQRSESIIASVKVKIRDLLIDTQVQPLPSEILGVLATQTQRLRISMLEDFFPSSETLGGMLGRLSHNVIDSSLAAIEPLIPTNAEPSSDGPECIDSRGFSSYARIVEALLRVFLEDRKLARQNLWALRHFIALSIFASDYQKVPTGSSPVFDAKALAGLGDLIIRVQQVTAYLFLGSLAGAQEGWRRGVIKSVGENRLDAGRTQLENFLGAVIKVAIESDSLLDTRLLKAVLEDVLEDLEQEEADEWMGLARKLEKNAPQTSMTIVSAITATKAEPLRLDRYRNEQAAELLGIRPSKVNSVGLLTLRKLAASAPDMESDVVFLPQNRAVNVVKACQGWVASDDADIDEEVESAMTLIFAHLAPILQNVPGAHWDFIWDVLENNLENSSITDDSTLATLMRSVRLVIIMEDLVKTNKSLKPEWDQRRKNILEMIKGLALVKLDTVSPSLPRSLCRELVLTVLRELPESLMDADTLPQMCHLVTDHSLEVQKMGYGILRVAAKKRTEHLVIEAGVDTESSVDATIPSELMDIVQRHVNFNGLEDEEEQQGALGLLLGWMLIFDLFQDASFKVKSGYIEQLRNQELIGNNFIPLLLVILRLEAGLEKAFKLNVWSINDFYVDLFELGSSISIHLLAAHLYYRALLTVPSLIYSWLSNCKDRQLSTTITSYTSQYFSPVIIDVELAHVKGPAGRELSDDSMTIKVATAVNEVQASYLVDEHQLEIKLKIPTDWPLHKIEVKDLKRVGVDQDRWRAWILAVQQTIWSHNGRITDGLTLFKKNATLHFEGQVECAICYSIISVMDGSLPKKPLVPYEQCIDLSLVPLRDYLSLAYYRIT